MSIRERGHSEALREYFLFSDTARLDELTLESSNWINSHSWSSQFFDQPEEVLRRLQYENSLFPLPGYNRIVADLCSYQAAREHRPDEAARYRLTAALAAYRELFGRAEASDFGFADARLAALYNLAVSGLFEYINGLGLATAGGFRLEPVFGPPVEFHLPGDFLTRPLADFSDWQECAGYAVGDNLSFSCRRGLGVPLLAQLPQPQENPDTLLRARVFCEPTTLFLRFGPEPPVGAPQGARFEFIDAVDYDAVTDAGRALPLALDVTTTIASGLSRQNPFQSLLFMLYPEKMNMLEGLYRANHIRQDRIPVVFTHGLMSSPRTWAQLLNSIYGDPRLRRHYQFWLFAYPTGNPLLYSAGMLRQALSAARTEWCQYDSLVLVGHSMGGLLSKSLIVTSDDAFVEVMLNSRLQVKIDSLTEEQRQNLKGILYLEPLPGVSRVLFLATPHRGSDMANWSLTKWASSLIALPSRLLTLSSDLLTKLHLVPNTGKLYLNTGLDNLAPDNLALRELDKLPLEDIPYHSIIGNSETGGVPGGSDGVVGYPSAHLDGADSETVVHSGHSVQSVSDTGTEVRRLLLIHLIASGRLNPDGSEITPSAATVPEYDWSGDDAQRHP